MPMLTQDDLKAIGTLIDQKIGPLEGKIEILTGRVDSLELTTSVRFDAVQEQLISIENRMVTKDYLDDKLAHYQRKPF